MCEIAKSQKENTNESNQYGEGDWCVWFVKWVANQNGLNTANGKWPDTGSTNALIKWFKDRNRWYPDLDYEYTFNSAYGEYTTGGHSGYEPKPGDIVFIENNMASNPADKSPDHTGLVIDVTDTTITTIEGNYAGKVVENSYSRSDRCKNESSSTWYIGFASPEYKIMSHDYEPEGSYFSFSGGAGSLNARGWVFDRDDSNYSVKVLICLGGRFGENGVETIETIAYKKSDSSYELAMDVGANHVFEIVNQPVSHVGKTVIYVYAIDAGGDEKNEADRKEFGPFSCTIQEASNLSAYEKKMNAFINDERWKHGSAWPDKQKPYVSTWNCTECVAYAYDFTKYMYGVDRGASGERYTNVGDIRSGDIVFVTNYSSSGHAFVVLKREGNTLYTAEGHWQQKARVDNSHYYIQSGALYDENGTKLTMVDGYHFETGLNETTEVLAGNVSASAYENKMNAFINDDRWKNGASWEDRRKCYLSTRDFYDCIAYAYDFTNYMYGYERGADGECYTSVSEIRTGDIVFIEAGYCSNNYGHAFVVLDRTGNSLYTAEGYHEEQKVRIGRANYYIQNGKLYDKNGTELSMDNGYHFVTVQGRYNRNAALTFAQANVSNHGGMNSHQFIAKCINAGGLSCDTNSTNIDGYKVIDILYNQYHACNQSHDGEYYDLQLEADGTIKASAYNPILMPGDIVLYHCTNSSCQYGPDWVYGVICNGTDERGYMLAYSNEAGYESQGDTPFAYSGTCPVCNGNITSARVFHFEVEERVTSFWPEGRFIVTSSVPVNNNTVNRITLNGYALDRDDYNANLDVYISVGAPWSTCDESLRYVAQANQETVSFGSGEESHHGFTATVDVELSGETEIYAYAVDNDSNSKVCIGTYVIPLAQLDKKLSGDVHISGSLKYDQTLTATVSNTNNTGSLLYQWIRGTDAINGATEATYKLVKEDIGQTISCEVSSSVESGTISATTASTISKADGPAAPSGMTVQKPSVAGASDGKIIFSTRNSYRYATQKSFSDAVIVKGTEITGLSAGTYYVKIAGTETRKESGAATVVIEEGPEELSGNVTINGTLKYGKTLTAKVSDSNNTGTLSYAWKRGTTVISGATGSTYKLVKEDIGKKISCEVTSSVEIGSISGTTSSTVSKADGPAAPEGISGTAPSAKGKADGKISGVTSAMEYAANESFSNKTACTSTEITGLVAGTYYVRYAETATHKASVAASVTVPEGKVAIDASAPKLNSATVSNGIVIFSWTANEGVTKYAVFRKVDSGSWAKIGEASGTSYADPTVSEGHTYTYTARGINAAGKYITSFDSTGKSVTISAAVDTSSPVVLSATSGTNGATVTWRANTGVTKYAVFRKTDSGKWTKLAEVSGTSYVDGTAAVGHTYVYTVRGVNAAGQYITSFDTVGKSVTISATLDTSAPVITEVTSGAYGVIVTWKANNGVTKYAIFRKTDSGKWTKIGESSGTSYLDSAVTDGAYNYTVRGVDASGKYITNYDTAGKRITVGGNQQETLDASSPVLGGATASANGITVIWTANSGVPKYAIFRKVAGGKWTKVGETTGTADGNMATAGSVCNYVDGTAVAGTTYTYTVRGIDESGKYVTNFNATGVTATMTTALDASSPVLGGATAGANGITVTWTANSGVIQYAIFRKVAGGKWTKVGETTGTAAGTSCSYIDGTAVAGTTYTYTVRGLDEGGKYVTTFNANGVSATAE
jgi:hypothetical protein